MATQAAFSPTLAGAAPGRPLAAWLAERPRLVTMLAMLLAAFAVRAHEFGNPLIEVDENFYLLVGDRMLHGALPYVDLWDRKPIGIFLLYAAIRLLGGGGIIQCQVVATLFAAGTAAIVSRIAARIATPLAGMAAGLLYLLMLGVTGGLGGQTPVFYNLFVAAAARLTLGIMLDDAMSIPRVRRIGALTMLLLGIAMQIKYSAVFEGVFLGLALLRELHRRGRSLGGILLDAVPLVAAALLPTALALGYYVWRGQAQAFIYANFVSIFARGHEPAKLILHRLVRTWMVLHLLIFCGLLSAAIGPWRRLPEGPRTFAFAAAWAGAAILGFLAFGTYFDHYTLPLLVPLSIVCAPLFAVQRRHVGAIAAGLLLSAAAIASAATARGIDRRHGGAAAMRATVDAITPRLRGCLYVFRGESLLYYETNACAVTRYVFPSHLTLRRESEAIGVDPLAEIRRVFAARPDMVVDAVSERDPGLNSAALALGRSLIAQDYHLVAIVRVMKRATFLYQRNAAPPRLSHS